MTLVTFAWVTEVFKNLGIHKKKYIYTLFFFYFLTGVSVCIPMPSCQEARIPAFPDIKRLLALLVHRWFWLKVLM